jgi:GntR family carbon starvation induced transcriptional regulator
MKIRALMRLAVLTLGDSVLRFDSENKSSRHGKSTSILTGSELVTKIRSDIISGIYRPDDRLKFALLGKQYGCSYGSIREALTSLVLEGFVKSEANKGFSVASVSSVELREITGHYIDLEKRAIVSAIDHGDDVWESNIVASHHRLKSIENQKWEVRVERHSEWLLRHREFHWSLVCASQGAWLLRLRTMMFDQLDRYRFITKISSESIGEQKRSEHQRLMEATIDRDKQVVTSLVEEHIHDTAERAVAVMSASRIQESESS